ncbi:MAG TPA: alpha/beta hydrolase [Egibacteraceae bacterium]|nr:alpha/beta hydrolase [Egibacteraceae bacterium]
MADVGTFTPQPAFVAGLRWHAVVAGRSSARPVVVLHGWGAAGEAQLPAARLLASSLRVLVPDLPGFGRSEQPSHVPTLPELADALAGWMTAMGLAPAVVVGNSMGCQVLAHLAARHPDQVDAVVLQGPTIDAGARTVLRQAARLAHGSRFERPSLGWVQARGVRQAGVGRLMTTLRHALDDRIEETVAEVACPLLVVRGSRDPLVTQQWAETVACRAPRGELRVVPGPGHCMVYSAPLELARLVRGFLGRH